MIAAIAAKEARGLMRDGRLLGMGIVLTVLLLVMLAVSVERRRAAEQERAEVEHTARAQWDHQGDKNPHRAAHFGLYAFKPASSLAAVDPGLDARTGQALWLEPHKRNVALYPPAADAAPSLGLAEPTPAFVLLALVPLLIAVAGHGIVAQERESGTLRMLHASGIRERSLVLGKWLGLCVGVGVVMLPALAIGAWLVAERQTWPRALLLMSALAPYYATWAGLTVIASIWAKTSRSALLALVALWTAGVLIVPRLGATLVERMTPLPTGEVFWSAIHHDIEQGLPGDGDAKARLAAFDAKLLAEHHVARLDDLPFGANASRRLFRDAYATRVHALHFGQLWERQLDQEAQLRAWTAISPYASMRAISASLAGTDLAHRRHFEDAAEAYRQRFTTWMDEWDLGATRGVTSFESRYAGDAQWQALPAWRYAMPGTNFALRSAWPDMGVQIAWVVVAVAAMLVSARRLRP